MPTSLRAADFCPKTGRATHGNDAEQSLSVPRRLLSLTTPQLGMARETRLKGLARRLETSRVEEISEVRDRAGFKGIYARVFPDSLACLPGARWMGVSLPQWLGVDCLRVTQLACPPVVVEVSRVWSQVAQLRPAGVVIADTCHDGFALL